MLYVVRNSRSFVPRITFAGAHARSIALRPCRGLPPSALRRAEQTARRVLQVVTTENVGTFTIVDLAGSERVKKSGASGQTMNEAQVAPPPPP